MKNFSRTFIAVFLAVLFMTLMPAQVFADSLSEYISEVKVYIGNYDNAASECFTILNGDNGKPVDLNQGAGGALALSGGAGLALGAVVTALAMKPKKKVKAEA